MGGTAVSILTSAAAGGIDGSALGNIGGSQTHQLSVGELPSHSHEVSSGTISGREGSGSLSVRQGCGKH